jgi:hypothetical protein
MAKRKAAGSRKKVAGTTGRKAARKVAKKAARKAARRPAARKAQKAAKSSRKAAKKTARKTASKTTRKSPKKSARRAPAPASAKASARSRRSASGQDGRKPVAKKAVATKTSPARKAAAKRSAPGKKVAAPKAMARKTPALNRERRSIADEEDELVPTPPSSLDLDRTASAVRSGRRAVQKSFAEHTETSPAMTAGDVDADWESAYSVGDEAPGGDNPTPDQDIVDDIGKAVGVEYQDNEELKGADKVIKRDEHRWELDPASAEDWDDRD